jgi:hypothetical protein
VAGSSPSELTATQKAAEAVESVFSARDTHRISWAQLRNRSDGGIFLDEEQVVKTGGEDGIVNTGDDGEAVEAVELPGPDQDLTTTADNRIERLDSFTRKITIDDISPVLRLLTVTIKYKAGASTQTYTLTAYISRFA